MKSIGKQEFYSNYIATLKSDKKVKEQRLFELRNSRYHLINLIEDKQFIDAYVVLPHLKAPIEYMAYFYKVKDAQRHFKLNECSIIDENKVEHEYSMFLKGSLYNVMRYNRVIKDVEEQIEEIDSFDIDYNTHKMIVDTHDHLLAGYLLDGKHYSFGFNIGSLFIKEKSRNFDKKVVDRGKTNKEKQRLIANGMIPYRKEDAEKAAANGEEYHGVKYLIYNYEPKSYWLMWGKLGMIRNMILYSFVPTHANNTGQSIYDLEKNIKFHSIPNCRVGFKQMIHLARRMNPKQAQLYRVKTA